MKTFRKRTIPTLITEILLITIFLFLISVSVCAEAPVKARITFLTSTFSLDDLNEQINLTITIENLSAIQPVFTQANFSALAFNLHLYFKGPGVDGGLITASTNTGDTSRPSISSRTSSTFCVFGWPLAVFSQ